MVEVWCVAGGATVNLQDFLNQLHAQKYAWTDEHGVRRIERPNIRPFMPMVISVHKENLEKLLADMFPYSHPVNPTKHKMEMIFGLMRRAVKLKRAPMVRKASGNVWRPYIDVFVVGVKEDHHDGKQELT